MNKFTKAHHSHFDVNSGGSQSDWSKKQEEEQDEKEEDVKSAKIINKKQGR